ncbi:gluconate kinase, SKI family [Agreia bicolorata]|uniref:Gluconokinase n=1 Tax=Agreia bicolorata TaxID=110935 RepID=A0A1T4Y7X7_9MICO|nr:gluconokinase [Agreia bicolorata]KJC64791.1 gluconate kinase [Agreia bicolorata]SKA97800.1 gluconate kinase, SKI family [Agreia bicolorata]
MAGASAGGTGSGRELVIVGGVSGSGKSTVGALLAQRLEVPFIDADSLHPEANVAKMAAGLPLDDIDREPWLVRIGEVLAEHDSSGLVLACSALKRRYRDTIRSVEPSTIFITLSGPRELIAARMNARTEHFMPASLLDSQLAAFEPLEPGETGADVSVDADIDDIVTAAFRVVRPA